MHLLHPARLPLIVALLLGACAQSPTLPGPAPSARCDPDYHRPDWDALERTVTQQRARWERERSPAYEVTVSLSSLAILPTARIHVEGDRVMSVVSPLPPGIPVDPNDYPTIDEIYASAAKIIEQERQDPETCVALALTFDPVQPVPHMVAYADMTWGVSDLRWTWTYTDYAPMP